MATNTPSVRIAEIYRRKIRDGELHPGDRLPTVKVLAEQHGVATATARAALSHLRVEGYITVTQRGSFVNDAPTTGSSAHDRFDRIRRTGRALGDGESKRVTAAELIIPPAYVCELFDVPPMTQVVRREYVVGSGIKRLSLSVDWYPLEFAEIVPDLLSTAPKEGDDLLQKIERATGRQVKYGRDSMHARTADRREANHLGVAVGASVLAVAHDWSDDEGVILYGETVMPERLTIGYEYRL
ncbi:GntR family transcriptional regulator [Streptomyces hygroscopicus]|uniref:GntR family transcriptional regulator n=1 Tax=Streptomyces hygroscopicus TaxID=1912 RepID=UPI0036AEE2A3